MNAGHLVTELLENSSSNSSRGQVLPDLILPSLERFFRLFFHIKSEFPSQAPKHPHSPLPDTLMCWQQKYGPTANGQPQFLCLLENHTCLGLAGVLSVVD